MMMQKLAFGVALILGVAACDTGAPTTPAATPASADAMASGGIDGVIAAAQADVGKDIGGGVTLLSAQASGNTMQFGFQFAATVDQIETLGRQEFEDGFTSGFVGSLCANPAVPVFMAAGGAVEVSMIDPAGASIIANRVTSC